MTADPHEVYLASQLFRENYPVTYHTLSRSQNIHVDEAKILLHTFYKKNTDKLTATYIIIGKSNNSTTIKLSKDVEQDKLIFSTIQNVSVYALLRNGETTEADLALENLKFPSKVDLAQQYYKNGMLEGPAIVMGEVKAEVNVVKREEPAKPVKQAEPKKEEKKVKSAGLLSNYTSRKGEKSKPQAFAPKRSSPLVSTYQYKSRKVSPKDRVVISSTADEGEDEDVDEVQKPTPAKPSTDLKSMFDDDEEGAWDFSDDDQQKNTKTESAPIPEENAHESSKEENARDTSKENSRETSKEENVCESPKEEKVQESAGTSVAEKSELPQSDNKEQNEESLFVEEEEDGDGIVTTVDEDGYFTAVKKSAPASKPARPVVSRTKKAAVKPKPVSKGGSGAKKQASIFDMFKK